MILVMALALGQGEAAAQFRAPAPGDRPRTGIRLPSLPAEPPSERDSNRCGCAPAADSHERLLESMDVRDEAFARAFRNQAPELALNARSCVPFAMSLDRNGELHALAMRIGDDGGGPARLVTLSRDLLAGAVLLQTEPVDAALGDVSSVTATLPALLTPSQSVRTALPPEILAEARTLVPLLIQPSSVSEEGLYLVRLAFDIGTPQRWSRLLSVEIIERASGSVVADTFWVDRGDLPGGFFSPDLRTVDHYFWTNPLSFTRISRGVGRSTLVFPRGGKGAQAASAGGGKKTAQRGGQKGAQKGASKGQQTAARPSSAAQRGPSKGAPAGAQQSVHASGARGGQKGALRGAARTIREPSAHAARSGRGSVHVARHHIGIDYAAPIGTPVVAVADGVVAHQGMSGAYGNLIVLSHAGGYSTYYAHLIEYAEHLRPGSEVRRGTEIGYVGSTGRSTGPHLHFEVRQAGRYLDPQNEHASSGPWLWQVSDRLPLLRQILLTDALALAHPIPSGAGADRPLVAARRCAANP